MPAPKGNKNRQKGLQARTEKIQFRTTKEIKERLKNNSTETGEPITELIERLVIAYFKK